MNVLVYDGAGVSPTSLLHTLYTLKRHLGTRYAVQTVSAQVLKSHPWASTCALLVFPGGRDVPYLNDLAPDATRLIRSYVKNGGSYLGLCAGAYFGSKHVEWEAGSKQEVVGDRPLRFFPGTCEGCTYSGFQYNSEAGARAVSLQPLDAFSEDIEQLDGLYYNGGGHFINAEETEGMHISPLLQYVGGKGDGKIAAALCKLGRGVALLSSVHIEYPLYFEPAASALRRSHPSLSDTAKSLMENARTGAMLNILRLLRLQTHDPRARNASPTIPLPQFLTFAPAHLDQAKRFLEAANTRLSASLPHEEYILVPDQTDTFHIYKDPPLAPFIKTARAVRLDEHEEIPSSFPKKIAVVTTTEHPDTNVTPLFSIPTFFKEVSDYRDRTFRWAQHPRLGDALLYGEVVTSTQTLLDRNPAVLRELPTPLVSLATFQLAGKGRGGNTWINPPGSLLVSFGMRPPPPPTRDAPAIIPSHRLVFVQYLAGLAVVEACRELLGRESEAAQRIRLKWPNDVYVAPADWDKRAARKAEGGGKGKGKAPEKEPEELKKLGGVLISTNFSHGQVDVVVGVGLNVLNDRPTTSLSQLASPDVHLTLERTAAVLASTFDKMWEEFVEAKGSFEPFIDLYLERWLHSDQLVTLTTVSPPIKIRLMGITDDYGMLRGVRETDAAYVQRYGAPEFYDLQPDGNSFDMFSGLIKTKR